jgi:hypothetical protein
MKNEVMKNDDIMARLAAARPASLVPAADPERRFRFAATAMAGGRTVRRGRRFVRRTAIAGGLVVGLAAAAIAVETVAGDEAAHTLPAANAAELLNRAADAAQAEKWTDPRPGQYFVVRSREFGNNASIGTHGPQLTKVLPGDQVSYYRPADGHGIHLDYVIKTTRPGMKGEFPMISCVGGRHPAPLISYDAMRKWPTDPRALRTFLLANVPEKITIPGLYLPFGRLGNDPDARLWGAAGALASLPVPPRLRAALFRVLAGISGVELVRDATDAAGRHGIAVARTYRTGDKPIGVVRDALIFTPDTYRYLGNVSQTAEKVGRIPVGSPLNSDALISITTTDHIPSWAGSPGGC